MPPRFVYWTILIDGKPTAFRARDREELLPTINQLKRKNQDVAVKWFARGQLWESPEAERASYERPAPPAEKRSRDWRPGGNHKDPRDRFKKKNRPERAWSESDRDRKPSAGKPPGGRPAPHRSPHDRPRSEGGWKPKPPGDRPRSDRPWQTKPTGPRATRKPWGSRPPGRPPFRPNRPPFAKKKRDDEPPDKG
jgi:23S rRNA pseudouridine2605 synthase